MAFIKKINIKGTDYDIHASQLGNSLKVGTGDNSLIINEGIASSNTSIAGGTTDKTILDGLLSGLAGTTAALTLKESEAKGALSISLGANNRANTGGSIALGYDNVSGGKGYYVTSIDTTNKTITLSTKQTSTSSPGDPSWNKGDKLFFVNDDRYWLEVAAKTSSNVVTVVDMPFTSLVSVNSLTSKPNERAIINVTQPESGTVDIGWGAIGIGAQNKVVGSNAYTVGYKNAIVGDFGAGFGQENAVGYSAFATGIGNQAKGKASVALGDHTEAIGNCSTALGGYTKATAYGAFAVGDKSEATGGQSVALGYSSKASDKFSIAAGNHAVASAYAAVALGSYVNATAQHAICIGQGSTASKDYAVALGGSNQATEKYSFAVGNSNIASNDYAMALGYDTNSSGIASYTEGYKTQAIGRAAHAEGENTIAENAWTHTEGYGTVAGITGVPKLMNLAVSDARASHAEGTGTHAKGPASHAEGAGTTAGGEAAHAEGYATIARGNNSHTEGNGCETLEGCGASHAGGYKSIAKRYGSFAHGRYLNATAEYQAVFGKYNKENADALFIVGNGTDTAENTRSNAFEVISNSDNIALKIGNTTVNESNFNNINNINWEKLSADNLTFNNFEEAKSYVESLNSNTYLGQIITIQGDICIVIENSSTSSGKTLQRDHLRKFNEYKGFESSDLADSYQGQYLFDTNTARPFYISFYDNEFPKESMCTYLLDSECCPVLYMYGNNSSAYSLYDLLPDGSDWEGTVSDLSSGLYNFLNTIGIYVSKIADRNVQLDRLKYLLPTIYFIFDYGNNKIRRAEILNLKNLQWCDSYGYLPTSAKFRSDGRPGWSFTVETNYLRPDGIYSHNITFNLSDFILSSDTNIRIMLH